MREKNDFTGFADKLEELIMFEFRSMLEKLEALGIPEASCLLFSNPPDRLPYWQTFLMLLQLPRLLIQYPKPPAVQSGHSQRP